MHENEMCSFIYILYFKSKATISSNCENYEQNYNEACRFIALQNYDNAIELLNKAESILNPDFVYFLLLSYLPPIIKNFKYIK